MKIIKLVAENFKGLKAIEITPDQNFQIISGKNAQGKTSVLDAIWSAIAGKEALKATDKPIRDGQEKAIVSVDLGDLKVTRKWSGDKTTLEVTAADGAKYNSPQTMLDNLIGKLSFDPLSFATQEDKKQKSTLQELVGINFDNLDKERKGHYEERTFHNVSAKKLEGALSELAFPGADTPTEEVSASDIINELKTAQATVRENEDKRRELNTLRQDATWKKTEIDELEARLIRQKSELEIITKQGVELKAVVETLVDPDTEAIQSKLEDVESINSKVRNAEKYRRIETEIKECKDASDWLTKKMNDIDEVKLNTLQSAQFPIAGLSFDEDGVTFNGIPFKQCSAAERLKVSMAMAMSLNPQLRVIRILDGSLLDSDNLKLIHEMAKEQDYQVWMELVDDSGKMGVMIEDGQIKEG
jgi:predicted ATP-dependent endonuclease of OLD family